MLLRVALQTLHYNYVTRRERQREDISISRVAGRYMGAGRPKNWASAAWRK